TLWLISAKRLFKLSHYQYVAMNLARSTLEWGASGSFAHGYAQRYYYPPGRSCSMIAGCSLNGATGYATKESYGAPNCFAQICPGGDIKACGLVPPMDPDTVDIGFEALQDG